MQDRDSPAVKKGEETFGDFKNNPYLCIVFFTELDLRLIIGRASCSDARGAFFMPITTQSPPLPPFCRKTPDLSLQPLSKVRKIFAHLPKLPYLCIVEQNKQRLSDARGELINVPFATNINNLLICQKFMRNNSKESPLVAGILFIRGR